MITARVYVCVCESLLARALMLKQFAAMGVKNVGTIDIDVADLMDQEILVRPVA